MAGLELDDPVAAAAPPAAPGQPGVIEVAGPAIVDPPLNILGLSFTIVALLLFVLALLWLMVRFRHIDE